MKDNLEVAQVLPSIFDGDDFPGYDKVQVSFKQLETIINRGKRDWIAALENQKAVYLITDKSNGKLYVGSATSDKGMLLQRWTAYIYNGHGGNKELVELVKKEGFDYIKDNFQYSILENYNAKVSDNVILERESLEVEYFDRNFKKHKEIFTGFTAQIIQHEMDHFEGIII
ncbi:peptide deformylase [Clostridium baratii]|uniref:peptide deformylase n=1 Tax=Clostridium baratii TaxID=1561 RepID=UPI0030D08295